MSEQGSNGDNGKQREDYPDSILILTNALKTGKISDSDWKRLAIRNVRPINSIKHDASSTDVTKRDNDLPNENDMEGSMSNDAMQKLEESFVMVESFTAVSPKTAQFELVQVEKDGEQAAKDRIAKEQEK